jgi:very-short-patch-repair endonuclease
MTDAERLLWSRVGGKQIGPVQFYRQKPVGGYIVDFYAPKAKLVIEVDGSQHREPENLAKDRKRDSNSIEFKKKFSGPSSVFMMT